MGDAELIKRLQGTGLNRLESAVYLLLCRQSPLTGYRIAQHLGEASANIYKALDTLVIEGAVMVEDTPGTRYFTAVPSQEYLARQKKDFVENCRALEKQLAGLSARTADERVYRLETIDQVMERAEEMIRNAEVQIVVDAFPRLLERIAPLLSEAGTRGVSVTVNGYGDVKMDRCIVVQKNAAETVLTMFPEDWLSVVVDADKYLLAVIDRAGTKVEHAIWSNSPHLSYVLASGMAAEILLGEASRILREHGLTAEIRKTTEKLAGLLIAEPPGYQKIVGKRPRNGEAATVPARKKKKQ
ncbi:MAG TPA: helix-turn-helix domain-containing protein [bacterium]|nr:helix-turn-helix domain-containing protein [bacterium]